MKPTSSNRFRCARTLPLATLMISFALAASADAAPLYWDTNGATAGSADLAAGTNVWGTDNNWSTDSTGSSATGAYVAGSDVVVSAGTNATGANIIRISGPQTANSLTFEEGTITLSAVTALSSDTLTLGAGGITMANGLQGNATIGGSLGNIVMSASQVWTNNTVTDPAALPVATTARTLLVGNGAAGSMLSGSATTGNTQTLTITGPTTALGTAATTLSTVLSDGANGGTLDLVKSGSAQLILSGGLANTYTGSTTISAGTLTLNKTTAGTNAISGNVITVNGGALRHNSASADNQIVDTAALTISSGSVSFVGADETLASMSLSGGTFSTGNTSGAASNVIFTGAITIGGSGKVTVNSGGVLSAQTVTLNGTNSGIFESSGGNILIGGGASPGTTVTQLLVGSGGLNMSGQTIQINAATGTLPGSKIELGGDFTTTGNNNNVIGYSTPTGSTTPITPTTPATLEIGSGTRNFTIAGTTLSTAIGGASSTTRIALQVVSSSGTGVLTKAGQGQLILSGPNTYAGQTNVNQGILRIQSGNALGTTAGGTVVAAGAGLQLEGGITVGNEALSLTGTSNTASTSNVTAGLSNLSGNNTYGGPIAVNLTSGGNNNVRINSIAGNLAITGAINLTGGVLDAAATTSLVLTGSGNGSVSGDISIVAGADDLGLIKTGTGTWTVTGTNTYTGATRVDAGTMVVNSIPTNLGGASNTSVIALGESTTNTGTLGYTGTGETVTRGFILNSTGTGGGRIEQSATSGNLVIAGNVTSVNSTGTKTFTLLGSTAATGEVTGNISNSGNSNTAVEKTGTGKWTLSGTAKAYSGTTSVTGGTLNVSTALTNSAAFTVTGGTLELGANNVLRDLSSVTLGTGGVLKTDGFDETSGALIVTGDATLNLTSIGSVMNFGQSDGTAWTGILSITGWDGLAIGGGSDQVIFANAGLTTTQLDQVNFVNPTGFAPGVYNAQFVSGGNEIVPGVLIPEPSFTLLAAVGTLGLCVRRKRAGGKA